MTAPQLMLQRPNRPAAPRMGALAYLIASAEASGIPDIIFFDRSIDRVTTTNRIEP